MYVCICVNYNKKCLLVVYSYCCCCCCCCILNPDFPNASHYPSSWLVLFRNNVIKQNKNMIKKHKEEEEAKAKEQRLLEQAKQWEEDNKKAKNPLGILHSPNSGPQRPPHIITSPRMLGLIATHSTGSVSSVITSPKGSGQAGAGLTSPTSASDRALLSPTNSNGGTITSPSHAKRSIGPIPKEVL